MTGKDHLDEFRRLAEESRAATAAMNRVADRIEALMKVMEDLIEECAAAHAKTQRIINGE